MLTLTEVKTKTQDVFENESGLKKLTLPEPPIIWKDKLEALSKSDLVSHRESLIFDMRCWQAEQLGFQKVDSSNLVQMLMGNHHTETADGETRQNYEWQYNHHDDVVVDKDKTWGGKATIFRRFERGLWHYPPFSKIMTWECQFGKLDYLKREIPYGVVLRINECKELKLFNVFNVLAPKEAWERKTDIDPIVIASIWEMPSPKEKDESRTAGQVAHFFLAQW